MNGRPEVNRGAPGFTGGLQVLRGFCYTLLEENCGRDVKAVAELFDLPSVQLTLFFQDRGHNTLAAQIFCKILLSKSIRIHQFL
jgi:hypothetical protein